MNIQTTGQNIKITPGLHSAIDRNKNQLTKYAEHIIDIHVILKVDNLDHIAEANINIEGRTFFSQAHSEDMYESLDRLFDKAERQLRRYFDRVQSRARKLSTHDAAVAQQEENNQEMGLQFGNYRVVSPKPMSPTEATLQANVVGENQFIFGNTNHPEFAEGVVLKSDEGKYQVIALNSEGQWERNEYQVNSGEAHHLSQSDYNVPILTIRQAIDEVEQYDLPHHVVIEPESNALNILFRTKNGHVDLITSDDPIVRNTSGTPEPFVM